MRVPGSRILTMVLTLACAASTSAQTTGSFEPPLPSHLYIDTRFALDGLVGFVPTYDDDVLWSFSTVTGARLDPDGLALGGPTSKATLFPGRRLALNGWFPDQGIFVADVSDAYDLRRIGVIPFPSGSNIQGQNIEVDDDGTTGFIASFLDDTLYSFSVETLELLDPDGLALPGNPDRIARTGDLLAMVDTTNGRILLADVSDPANLSLAGIIPVPGAPDFGSANNIVFTDDGRTGFVASRDRVLFSFDLVTRSVLDALPYGTRDGGLSIARHGGTVACAWARGLSFVDVTDPTDLRLIADADFGELVALQGNATAGFSEDGTKAAVGVIYPAYRIYAFHVTTGEPVRPPVPVGQQPNYLTVFAPDDRIGVLCSGPEPKGVWLVRGMLAGCETAGLAFRPGSASTFEWDAPTAYACGALYDAVQGSLGDLRSAGDLSGADCLPGEDDDADLEATDPVDPLPGEGAYYMSRVDDETWNTSLGGQGGDRDASVSACP